MTLEVNGTVARLVFDRPDVLNAGDARWVADLTRACQALAAEKTVRVVVMTGRGRAFQTGVDLQALARGEVRLDDLVRWEDAMTAMERMDKLFIAAINGHAIGGGLQLALVCDYRLASADALVGLPAVKECLVPSMALYRLPRLIGLGRAQDLILTGRLISAADAERYGLVNRVVPPGAFAAALDETIEMFLALPETSAGVSKRLVPRAFDLPFDDFRREMQAGLADCFASDEHRAAMAAILARRRR
ncbi:MAG: enoyl-CoA hydratase/isomerase family protein [Candidatus Rokubacteria bacterium]|nr:enoyl-CoA hydratase/isomerase family protein [Candidatus Rokubacteria bacterium]